MFTLYQGWRACVYFIVSIGPGLMVRRQETDQLLMLLFQSLLTKSNNKHALEKEAQLPHMTITPHHQLYLLCTQKIFKDRSTFCAAF